MLQNLMRKMKKGNKGFTLVELMIVVVIIGILIAIAIPIYQNIKENAEYRACAANRRTIRSQMEVYNADTGLVVGTDTDLATFLGMVPEYFAETPTCPTSGGGYSLSGGVVTCAVHGTDTSAP